MKLPCRLNQDPDHPGASLVRSARSEGPPRDLAERVLAALGPAALLPEPPSSGDKAADPASSGGSAAEAPGAPTPYLKWAVVGISAAGLLLGGAWMSLKPAGQGASAAAYGPGSVARVEPSSLATAESPPEAPSAPLVEAVPGPELPAPASRPPAAPVVAAASALPSSSAAAPRAATLSEEILMLDEARTALRAGQPDRAMSALDAYAARFPAGRLALESAVLRVESLAARGDRQAAAALASRLLSAHPASPFAARLRPFTAPPSSAAPPPVTPGVMP